MITTIARLTAAAWAGAGWVILTAGAAASGYIIWTAMRKPEAAPPAAEAVTDAALMALADATREPHERLATDADWKAWEREVAR